MTDFNLPKIPNVQVFKLQYAQMPSDATSNVEQIFAQTLRGHGRLINMFSKVWSPRAADWAREACPFEKARSFFFFFFPRSSVLQQIRKCLKS